MKQILAMSKPNAICAIHCATADGFFKDTKIFEFIFAGLFSSAFLFSTKKVDLSARSCPNKFGRDARLMINFLPSCHPERSPKGGVEGSSPTV